MGIQLGKEKLKKMVQEVDTDGGSTPTLPPSLPPFLPTFSPPSSPFFL